MNSHPDFNRSSHNAIAPRDVMQQVRLLTNESKRVELVSYLEQQITQYPQDKFLRMALATTHTKLGEIADACGEAVVATAHYEVSLKHAMIGLQCDDRDVRLLTQAGKDLRLLGDYQKSESLYRRAVCLDPTDRFTWTAMGDLFHIWAQDNRTGMGPEERDGLLQDAVNCFARTLELEPLNPRAADHVRRYGEKGIHPASRGYDFYGDEALAIIGAQPAAEPQKPVISASVPALDRA